MKRKRRLPASKKPAELVVEQDVATEVTARTVRSPAKRYSNLKMPHERDESTHASAKPSAIVEQAAQDLGQGKVETDCYTATGERFDRKHRQR